MIYLIRINRAGWMGTFDYEFDNSTDALFFYEQEKGNCINGDVITIYECKMIDTYSLDGI